MLDEAIKSLEDEIRTTFENYQANGVNLALWDSSLTRIVHSKISFSLHKRINWSTIDFNEMADRIRLETIKDNKKE